MALHGQLRINDQLIGSYEIIRTTALGVPSPADDSVQTYKWVYKDNRSNSLLRGEIVHRFGAGAEFLLAMVLLAVKERLDTNVK